MKITGVMFAYYFVCKRKLWYFSRQISMENESEDVLVGRLLDQTSYNKEDRHVLIDNAINIDFITETKVIHEIKKSRKIEEAGIWQVKYYIYYLKKLGVENVSGQVDYPLLRRTLTVDITNEDVDYIEMICEEISAICDNNTPLEVDKKGYCKKCSYYDLCMI